MSEQASAQLDQPPRGQLPITVTVEPICVGRPEIARLLGVSERTIAGWVREGKIPHLKPNGADGRLLFPIRLVRRHFERMAQGVLGGSQ